MKPFLFLLFGLFLFSFGEKTERQSDILGYWVLGNYEVESATYHRRADFAKDEPGVCFQKNGKLLKRQNSGWCGTPPITYKNYEGSWEQKTDSTLLIRYKFWGGMAEEEWQITYLEGNIMKIQALSYKNDRDKEWQVKEPH
ncbi:MAG: hypothetical protein ACO1O6_04420 [Bacteroidota bacterium]